MNLEELRDVRRTERQRDGLQDLRESFYRDVAAYLADLKAERERAAERADDPFSDPEVRRLTDEIETAEDVVESIYERRVGKVVKRASFAAAGMTHDEEGLTDEERDLFDDLVARIERNRERVLESLDPDAAEAEAADARAAAQSDEAGDASAAVPPGEADAPDPNDLLSEAMGGTDDASPVDADEGAPTADGGTDVSPADAAEAAPTPGAPAPTPGDAGQSPEDAGQSPKNAGRSPEDAAPAPTPGGAPSGSADAAGTDAPAGSAVGDDAERTTVYVTRDVGEIFGVDERTYRLAAEDVVDLPADNAEALVARGAAEPLE